MGKSLTVMVWSVLQPGKPLLASLLLYLSPEWHEHHLAETLFEDSKTGTGVLVRPQPGRVVLFHNDMFFRESLPSELAGKPSYSLLWELIFVPKGADSGLLSNSQQPLKPLSNDEQLLKPLSISRPEWGPPVRFGSCAAFPVQVKNQP